MDILIAGAGIGGLAAAVALRKHGHRITLFEQSRLATETGAAIFLPPNANGLLRQHGFIAEEHGGNLCLGFRHYSPAGELIGSEAFAADQYTSPWHLIHRQKLHAGLKALATDHDHPGPPAKIAISSRVVSVDTEKAEVTLEGGTTIAGDVVLGADGMHSKTREFVQAVQDVQPGQSCAEPFSSGKNCFRFLIPRKALLANPLTAPIYEANDVFSDWTGEDRRLICYPCDDNSLMNFVAVHPSDESDASNKDWHSGGSKTLLVSLYTTFGPSVRAIVEMAEPESVRLYPLMDMDPLPGWVAGRLALLGDAAHPFLPYMGQGGAQAIEDGMSLGVMLVAGVTADEIASRLQLYEKARMSRAHRVKESTRKLGLNKSKLQKLEFDVASAWQYNLEHDELEHSQRVLQEYLNTTTTTSAGEL